VQPVASSSQTSNDSGCHRGHGNPPRIACSRPPTAPQTAKDLSGSFSMAAALLGEKQHTAASRQGSH
jgi:hypothetical protein